MRYAHRVAQSPTHPVTHPVSPLHGTSLSSILSNFIALDEVRNWYLQVTREQNHLYFKWYKLLVSAEIENVVQVKLGLNLYELSYMYF